MSSRGFRAVDDNRPLNEREFQQVQRLFSDPFSFPSEFKNWLISFLETSDMTLPKSAVQGLPAALSEALAATSATVTTAPAGLRLGAPLPDAHAGLAPAGLRLGATVPTVTP